MSKSKFYKYIIVLLLVYVKEYYADHKEKINDKETPVSRIADFVSVWFYFYTRRY